MVGCRGNKRSGLNFARGTSTVPAVSSKSDSLKRKASPMRRPVQAINPIKVT